MAKNGFGLHRQSIVAFDEPSHYRSAQSPTHRGACFPHAEKQSAATQRSVTADRELLQSYCLLLFDHGTADYDAAGGVCTHILELPSAIADHEVAAMVPRQSHGAGSVRIHSIGPGDILTPTRIDYEATTEVKDQTCRKAACAIERIQARFVHWPIDAYGRGYGW